MSKTRRPADKTGKRPVRTEGTAPSGAGRVSPPSRVARDQRKVCDVYVIMPFTSSPTRGEAQLNAFFEHDIKATIEAATFSRPHRVRRSDSTLNINEAIIRDLYEADVVVCDLSGLDGNPNVMYELGIRLAVTNKPVILIREKHKDNHQIFDVAGFHAFPYDVLSYATLRDHLVAELRALDAGTRAYESPVLSVLKQNHPLLARMTRERAARLLSAQAAAVHCLLRAYGGALHAFLMSQKPPIDLGTKEVVDFGNALLQNASKLEGLDWKKFHFVGGANPALEHYLSTLYLVDLVQSSTEEIMTATALEYNVLLSTRDTAFGAATRDDVIRTFVASAHWRVCLNHCIAAMEAPDGAGALEAERKAVEQCHRLQKLLG